MNREQVAQLLAKTKEVAITQPVRMLGGRIEM
jgi:hypothetical protein